MFDEVPKYDGVTGPSTYVFTFVCFAVGFFVPTVLSAGKIQYDDSEGAGFSPVTRMPDGKIGISEFGLSTFGFVLLFVIGGALVGLAWLVRYVRLH